MMRMVSQGSTASMTLGWAPRQRITDASLAKEVSTTFSASDFGRTILILVIYFDSYGGVSRSFWPHRARKESLPLRLADVSCESIEVHLLQLLQITDCS